MALLEIDRRLYGWLLHDAPTWCKLLEQNYYKHLPLPSHFTKCYTVSLHVRSKIKAGVTLACVRWTVSESLRAIWMGWYKTENVQHFPHDILICYIAGCSWCLTRTLDRSMSFIQDDVNRLIPITLRETNDTHDSLTKVRQYKSMANGKQTPEHHRNIKHGPLTTITWLYSGPPYPFHIAQ